MKNWKFHLKMVLAKSAAILNNVFSCCRHHIFFALIIRDNLDPFFSFNVVPDYCFSPTFSSYMRDDYISCGV
jgi:hypothetical protein